MYVKCRLKKVGKHIKLLVIGYITLNKIYLLESLEFFLLTKYYLKVVFWYVYKFVNESDWNISISSASSRPSDFFHVNICSSADFKVYNILGNKYII